MKIPRIVKYAIGFLLVVAVLGVFAFGIVVQRFKVFPYRYIAKIENAIVFSAERTAGTGGWYYKKLNQPVPETRLSPGFDPDQLYLLSIIGPEQNLFLRLIDATGDIKNEWKIDWFELWPDATHLPPDMVPKMRPGTTIHGIELIQNGDVVFNMENLGLIRMTPCGETVWKLPYQTHHSIDFDDEQNLWVSGLITQTERPEKYPGYAAPYTEPTILKVSPDGEILVEMSVFDILAQNNLMGHLFMSTPRKEGGGGAGDTLHLNDVEIFTSDKAEGVFKHGDVMVSLRNINTIFVFDPDTLKIKYIKTGVFTRQHDPDFIDGNTISVFDNNNIALKKFKPQSRVLVLSVPEDTVETWYQGTTENPFFTDVMGAHDWISHDTALLTDSSNGRVLVVNSAGETLWEYFNATGPSTVGIVPNAIQVPDGLYDLYQQPQSERCSVN